MLSAVVDLMLVVVAGVGRWPVGGQWTWHRLCCTVWRWQVWGGGRSVAVVRMLQPPADDAGGGALCHARCTGGGVAVARGL